jgi:hypothetical protein
MKSRNPSAFQAFLERMKRFYNAKNQKALAEHIGIDQTTISKTKHKGVVQQGWIDKILGKHPNLSPEWVRTGQGPIFRDDPTESLPEDIREVARGMMELPGEQRELVRRAVQLLRTGEREPPEWIGQILDWVERLLKAERRGGFGGAHTLQHRPVDRLLPPIVRGELPAHTGDADEPHEAEEQ